jgi:hypothetical protein
MSALIQFGKYFSATLSDAPLETEHRLVAAWVKRGAEGLNSQNTIFDLRDTGGTVFNMGRSNGTPTWFAFGANGQGNTFAGTRTIASDSWVLVGTFMSGNTGTGSVPLYGYCGGLSDTANVAGTTVASRTLANLFIGRLVSDGSNYWKGFVAEVSVFKPSSVANATAIMAELASYRADTIPSGTAIFYAPLLSDTTVDVGGVTLTNTGSTTFNVDHPSVTDYVVATAPTIDTHPSNVTKIVGETATFTAAATDEDSVQWQFDDGGGWASVVGGTGATTDSYTTAATTLAMNGYQYRAAYTNGEGTTNTNAAILTVDAPVVKGIRVQLFNGATEQAGITGITAVWWDTTAVSEFATDLPVHVSTVSTDASGWVEIDIDTVTTLEVDDSGFVMFYKSGASATDALVFASTWQVEDIS